MLDVTAARSAVSPTDSVCAATTFVPDAVALAAPLLAVADPGGGDPLERVRGVAAAMAPHGVDAWRAMVERAESFLAGWQDTLPYGRPLA